MIKESYLMVDALVQKDNLFTRMDARIKVIYCLLSLLGVIGLPGIRLPLAVFALAVAAMLAIKTPVRLIVGRVIPPLVLGIGVFVFMLFTNGSQPLFTVNAAGWQLTGYREGLMLGLTVLTRIAGSVSVLMFLSVTTPVYELGYALIWLKVPKVIVEILLLTYRYLFVLWDEGMRIRQAQTMRLGYPDWRDAKGWSMAFKSTCTMMGMVFIRAYDRAESTYSAMQVRAYNGEVTGNGYRSWNRQQTSTLVTGMFIILLLLIFSV